jgi:hypothetical protein
MLKSVLAATAILCSGSPLQASQEQTSQDCIRILQIRCGGDPVAFNVTVGADFKVSDVQPKVGRPSSEVIRAAKCLTLHTDQLDRAIYRSHERAPFEFEFTAVAPICEDVQRVESR